MKNKTLKIMLITFLVLLIIMLPNLTQANIDATDSEVAIKSSITVSTTEGGVKGGDAFLNAAQGSPINQEETKKASDILFNTLLAVGIAAAMITAVALGIKFMIGSTSEKAQVKQIAIPFVVGCILVFGGFVIWKLVVTLMSNF